MIENKHFFAKLELINCRRCSNITADNILIFKLAIFDLLNILHQGKKNFNTPEFY